jgi:hypothetical protein
MEPSRSLRSFRAAWVAAILLRPRDPFREVEIMDTHMPKGMSRTQAYELSEDNPTNPSTQPTMGDVINARLGRRDVLRGALAVSAMSAVAGPALLSASPAKAQAGSFPFEELEAGTAADHRVAPGYSADVLIRWGDPVVTGAPDFDVMNQTADAQELQFGYNNDYVGYLPLPAGSDDSTHGLLVVNHEYTNEELMFPGLGRQDSSAEFSGMTEELANIEMSAHGLSVVEIRKVDGKWQVVPESDHGRRISARTTEMEITGPAAGHARMQTSADPTGTRVIGTINNCAGGTTPWGTVVTAEENFHGYFWGAVAEDSPEFANHDRYGVPGGWYNWGAYHDRFDVSKEVNEPNRFGWMVEIDPYDPTSTPMKRTAMGRFKHEGAESIVAESGNVVFYMGDDQRFDYLYKFVTAGTFNPDDRAANMGLLDEGTLYVAKFNEDGTLEWMPLVHGEGPLTAENGFESQADVMITTRLAADLLGATPMDRPEDVEPNPATGKIYVMLTNNTRREEVNAANPRPDNGSGHIIEITEDGGDHTATGATWEFLVLCGDPSDPAVGAQWNPATTENGWFGDPDNCAVDGQGRLWITTDGNSFGGSGRNDGVWALETEGELRGMGKHFYSVPVGAEMCGPKFTPDDATLFVAVQHPGDGGEDWPEFGRESTFEDPSTRWPDFQDGMPPRPSVGAITKDDGGLIGS